VRLALHSGVILALLISFSQAHLDHFHPGDPDHGHDHLASARVAEELDDHDHESVLDAPDHDSTARLKDWLAGDGSTPSKQYAESVSLLDALALVVVERSVSIVSLRNHDPPAFRVEPARGPPSIACL